MKYKKVSDGEWVRLAADHRIACCDCGLVHRVWARVRDGEIEFKAVRDNRATAAKRRKNTAAKGGK